MGPIFAFTKDQVGSAFIRKLEEFRTQFQDIERQLVDPEILTDHRAIARLSARRKALEPLVHGLLEFEAAAEEAREWETTIAAGRTVL